MNSKSSVITPKVSVAPMVDRTDRHFRYFCRLMTKKALLYTEMITAQGILHGDRGKLLDFNPVEKPLALQIAGCKPDEIYEAVKLVEDWDYDEINLNVGCPSDRVSGNDMGAVLMAYPEVVADMVSAIRSATKKPVTVKHRIGIEGRNILPDTFLRTLLDQYEDMINFIDIVRKSEVDRFIIHARIAILEGLSPKENREIPPLRYDEVYILKQQYPELNIEINGGIKTIEDIKKHLLHVDGVMVGRAAYENPVIMAGFDELFGCVKGECTTRRSVVEGYLSYVEEMEEKGFSRNALLRHTLGLFYGKRGSGIWKQIITPPWEKEVSLRGQLNVALESIPQEVLDESI